MSDNNKLPAYPKWVLIDDSGNMKSYFQSKSTNGPVVSVLNERDAKKFPSKQAANIVAFNLNRFSKKWIPESVLEEANK